jgi:hypothetical protein
MAVNERRQRVEERMRKAVQQNTLTKEDRRKQQISYVMGLKSRKNTITREEVEAILDR